MLDRRQEAIIGAHHNIFAGRKRAREAGLPPKAAGEGESAGRIAPLRLSIGAGGTCRRHTTVRLAVGGRAGIGPGVERALRFRFPS